LLRGCFILGAAESLGFGIKRKITLREEAMKNNLRILGATLVFAANIFAQGYWSPRFAQVGTNNNVPQAIAVDGSGNTYIGGGFDYAFGVKTNYFAKWNPQTGWDSIPGKFYGSSFPISSIAIGANNNVYVAGQFSGVGTLARSGIVKWDGVKWDSVPGAYSVGIFPGPFKIMFANGILYAIGPFAKAGNVAAKGIAKFDGTKWDSLGRGLNYTNSNNSVNNRAITVDAQGRIYAATYSINLFSKEDVAIIRWNGTQWDTIAKGLTGTAGSLTSSTTYSHVNDIAVYGDTIYVVGAFSKAGNKVANCIAKWNGTSWDSLGTGISVELTNVEVDAQGRVYVAGKSAPSNGGNSFGAISRWNGKTWENLGSGITKTQYFQGPVLHDMKLVDDKLYICGDFTDPGGIVTTGAVIWDITKSQWTPMLGKNTNGFSDGVVYAVHETPSGEIYVGGDFNHAGHLAAKRIAKWNGTMWDSVSSNNFKNVGTIKAITGDDSVIYFGGSQTGINGVNSSGVIKWNGKNFVSMNVATQPGIFMSDVRAMVRYGNAIIVGGNFTPGFGTSPPYKYAYSLIKWDGTKWDSLDVGIRTNGASGQVNATLVKNSDLYAAGNFTSAGTIPATNIARWNGTQWSSLGSFDIRYNASSSQATVTAMAFIGNDLYIAGKFDSIGTKPMWHIAKWNGTQWDSVSLGLKGDFYGITDMAVDKSGRIYIVGKFTSVGGDNTKQYVVRWNGSQWEKLGSGLTSNFSQDMFMAESDSKGNIWMSGFFGYADGLSSQNFARWVNDPATIDAVKRINGPVLPKEFSLSQNYPNPFNPSTKIEFQIFRFENVTLKVYDIIGREVATLVNEKLNAGKYEVHFDASKLSSGVYFYRLQTEIVSLTKKMVLLK
jgi:hypothetical protein